MKGSTPVLFRVGEIRRDREGWKGGGIWRKWKTHGLMDGKLFWKVGETWKDILNKGGGGRVEGGKEEDIN